jgi:hypothetical protein
MANRPFRTQFEPLEPRVLLSHLDLGAVPEAAPMGRVPRPVRRASSRFLAARNHRTKRLDARLSLIRGEWSGTGLLGVFTPTGSNNKAQGRRRRTLGTNERNPQRTPSGFYGVSGSVLWNPVGVRRRTWRRHAGGGPAFPGCAARPWASMCHAFSVRESMTALQGGGAVALRWCSARSLYISHQNPKRDRSLN